MLSSYRAAHKRHEKFKRFASLSYKKILSYNNSKAYNFNTNCTCIVVDSEHNKK